MEILKIKQQQNGYLVNDTMSVPNSEGNRHYKMVQEWLAIEGNVAEAEFTQAELDEQALQTSISEAQTLLKDTDFYVIRKMEESIDIPAEIVTARVEAKTVLRDNNITYTLGAE